MRSRGRGRGGRRPRRKITLVLLFLPNFYLLTNLPVFIVILLEIFSVSSNITMSVEISNSNSNRSSNALDGYDVAFHFARSLMYTNNCLNVFFFILLGDFLKMLFLNYFAETKSWTGCKKVRFKRVWARGLTLRISYSV